MMALRSAPGETLDRVAQKGESFIVERNGQQMACLVPLSAFMPDIQPVRLSRELERLQSQDEKQTVSITDDRELSMHFRGEGPDGGLTLTILLPHGYPNAAPKVSAAPLPDNCPHRWQDGNLCIFGATELWNPGQHDVLYVLQQARRWLSHLGRWQQTGEWGEEQSDDR
jgi:ubiquitin-protein ligase